VTNILSKDYFAIKILVSTELTKTTELKYDMLTLVMCIQWIYSTWIV